ncbi:hypothetical protein ACWCOP_05595 [Maricaulaceae bacterium MS644]
MTILDISALRAAFRFPLDNSRPVLTGALIYGVIFAAQTLSTAYAAAGAGWGAPTALVFILAGFVIFVVALSAWGRTALHGEAGAPGFGPDERRLLWAAFLVVLLVGIVVMTAAFLAFCIILGASMVAISRQGYDEPPADAVNTFALLNTAEWGAVWLTAIVFIGFSLWFFARLVMAYPATVDQRKVQVLTAWPFSGKRRALEIALTLVLAAAPGVIFLVVFNRLSEALIGAWPGAAQSAVTSGADTLSTNPVLFGVAALIYGAGKIALVAAPCAAALCALYVKYRTETEESPPDPET